MYTGIFKCGVELVSSSNIQIWRGACFKFKYSNVAWSLFQVQIFKYGVELVSSSNIQTWRGVFFSNPGR
jgi:hypothetical protein